MTNFYQKKAMANKFSEKNVIKEMGGLPKLSCRRCNKEMSYSERISSTSICPWELCGDCLKLGIDAGKIIDPIKDCPF
jgi:Flp pilus assembly protein TadG